MQKSDAELQGLSSIQKEDLKRKPSAVISVKAKMAVNIILMTSACSIFMKKYNRV